MSATWPRVGFYPQRREMYLHYERSWVQWEPRVIIRLPLEKDLQMKT